MIRATLVAFVLLCGATQLRAQPAAASIPECAGGTSADSDADGLTDICEYAMARTFAPMMAVRARSCGWDASEARLGGGYFHAVQPVDSIIRIAYLPAYFRDCGWSGTKCALPWVNCAPHAGDSEIILADIVAAGGDRWTVSDVFLSAHCFSRRGSDCRWYRGDALRGFAWHGAAPIVWVAQGRNANYPSWVTCDRGHYYIDSCDGNDAWVQFPVVAERNLGSRSAPSSPDGCVSGRVLASDLVQPDAVECFWRDGEAFGGWQGQRARVTGYARYLRELARF